MILDTALDLYMHYIDAQLAVGTGGEQMIAALGSFGPDHRTTFRKEDRTKRNVMTRPFFVATKNNLQSHGLYCAKKTTEKALVQDMF